MPAVKAKAVEQTEEEPVSSSAEGPQQR